MSETDPRTVPDHDGIELVRIRDRTVHVSPVNREKEKKFIVRNNSADKLNYIFLPLREFKIDLEVYDEDETELNVYPNAEVEDYLEHLEATDEEQYQEIRDRLGHAEYKLLIQLPPDNPTTPGAFRTITLRFQRSESVSFYSIFDPKLHKGWYKHWRRKLFRIPSFAASATRYPGNHNDEFVIAVGPPGYVTTGDIDYDPDAGTADFHENGLGDETRVFSARLPPADEESYDWQLDYDLIPNNDNLMKALGVFWYLGVIVGIASIALAGLDGWLTVPSLPYAADINLGTTTSASFITGIGGLIFALRTDWTSRYRVLLVIPLILHAIAWLLWST